MTNSLNSVANEPARGDVVSRARLKEKVAGVGDRQRAVARTLVCERAVARGRRRAEVRLAAIHTRVITGGTPKWRTLANARVWSLASRARRDVVGIPFRAITDDDLLRFFAVCETAGMLG